VSGRIGVCSWSLEPTGARDLVGRTLACGLTAVQLALDPVRTGDMPLDDLLRELSDGGITVLSGMMAMAWEDYTTLESIRRTGGVVPDDTWPANLAAAAHNARNARELGISLVTFHAGFVPHEADNPLLGVLVDRVRHIADVFAHQGVSTALETGQETAHAMSALLEMLDGTDVGVNFDPANMILYGQGDPVAALDMLAPHVRTVHIKDAIPAPSAGVWGTEMPVGEGAVDWSRFFALLHARGLRPDLVIERESGESRVEDVRTARQLIERMNG
jgi:sugar phosphate isomerase/epimerase